MALPGLLIEYLIAGGLALPWLLPLLASLGFNVQLAFIPLMAVLLYAVGMLLDFCAYVLLLPSKRWLRRRIAARMGKLARPVSAPTATRQVKILLYAPDLAKEVNMRSSRDRIARSTMLNCLLAAIAWRRVVPWQIGAVVAVLCLAMWIFFERSSYSFELRAEEAIDAKLAAGRSVSAV